MKIDEAAYVALDTETTGTDPDRTICELWWVNLKNGLEGGGLCQPGRAIDFGAMGVHHITPEMLTGQPSWDERVDDMVRANPGAVWVAHNAPFDREAMHNKAPGGPWIDTFRWAKHLWPEAPTYSLQGLRYWQAVPVTPPHGVAPHRAAYDTAVLDGLFRVMIAACPFDTVDELVSHIASPIKLERFPFGKHAGKRISDVVRTDRGYCNWLLRQPDMDADLKFSFSQAYTS